MQKRRLAALFLAIGIAIVMPTIALATSSQGATGGGLVPCGVANPMSGQTDVTETTECQACDVVALIQNVINFLIGLSVPLAMAMFAYAGFLYFTSSTNGENIGRAKGIFKSAVIGFVLVLCSWLIVNTILTTVVNSSYMGTATWFHIDCVSGRQVTGNIGNVIAGHLGSAGPVTPIPATPTVVCATGYDLTTNSSGVQICMNDAGKTQAPKVIVTTARGGTNALCSQSNPACSSSALINAGASEARANALSCIAMTESSGNPSARSNSSTACGTFQILNGHWSEPGLQIAGCSASSCTNVSCNLKMAINLGNQNKASGRSYYSDWTCPGCNAKASACVAKYDPGN